jgi:hypothetical protein
MSENIYAVQNGTNFENMKTFGVPPVLFLTKGGVRDLYFASSQPSCMTAIAPACMPSLQLVSIAPPKALVTR